MARWALAERFGWTLEYIDAMTVGDMHELIQIDEGRAKDREQQNRSKSKGRSGGKARGRGRNR